MHLDLAKSSNSLVLTSIIASAILLIILGIYRYIFPKQKIHPLLLVILISILPVISIFRIGSYESGDLSLHTMRTISFYNLLFNEHILPRWTPEFNVGYGDPYFLFSYFLPYFIGAVFHFIGFSFLMSLKLLLALSYILSGVTMYLWTKEELGEKGGFVAALFYLFVPYHLVDLHFRVSIAEDLSYVFVPLLLYFTKKIFTQPKLLYVIGCAITYALLILSHQIIALSFFPISLLYGLLKWRQKKNKEFNEIVAYVVSIFFGLLLSLFYWLPILLEAKYTQASLTKNIATFVTFPELLYSPWRLGFLFQGHHGELSFLIGYTQLFVIIAAIYLLVKNQINKKYKFLLISSLVLFFLLVILMLPIAKPIWQTVPFLQYFQYSYRLLEIVALCTSIIAGIVVTKWNSKTFIVILCSLTIFYTILNWGNRRAIPQVQDAYLISEYQRKPDVGMYLEPSSPVWTNLQKAHLRIWPKSHIEILSGKAQIKELSRTAINHKYIINAENELKIKENTLYFPGWTLLEDGKQFNIAYTNPKYPGVITFTVPKGLHEIELAYKNTLDRSIADAISIFSLVFTLLLLLYSLVKRFLRPKLFLSNNANISGAKRKRNSV